MGKCFSRPDVDNGDDGVEPATRAHIMAQLAEAGDGTVLTTRKPLPEDQGHDSEDEETVSGGESSVSHSAPAPPTTERRHSSIARRIAARPDGVVRPANVKHTRRLRVGVLDGATFLNQYIVVDTLGRGSYGKVKLCLSTPNDELVAVKVVSRDLLKAVTRTNLLGRHAGGSDRARRAAMLGRRSIPDGHVGGGCPRTGPGAASHAERRLARHSVSVSSIARSGKLEHEDVPSEHVHGDADGAADDMQPGQDLSSRADHKEWEAGSSVSSSLESSEEDAAWPRRHDDNSSSSGSSEDESSSPKGEGGSGNGDGGTRRPGAAPPDPSARLKFGSLGPLSREVEVMRRLRHPNLVRLLEVIEDRGSSKVLMVMEYAAAGQLLAKGQLSRERRMPEIIAHYYFCQMAAGMAHLHANHVVHGDMKPDNVLLSGDGTVKITDFGQARFFSKRDRTSKTVGTPAFLAPEICAGKSYSGRAADMWALGVSLYQFIYGELPFSGETATDLYDAIREGAVPYPENVPMSLELQDLFLRILNPNPSARITAQELMEHAWIRGDIWTSLLTNFQLSDGAWAQPFVGTDSLRPEEVAAVVFPGSPRPRSQALGGSPPGSRVNVSRVASLAELGGGSPAGSILLDGHGPAGAASAIDGSFHVANPSIPGKAWPSLRTLHARVSGGVRGGSPPQRSATLLSQGSGPLLLHAAAEDSLRVHRPRFPAGNLPSLRHVVDASELSMEEAQPSRPASRGPSGFLVSVRQRRGRGDAGAAPDSPTHSTASLWASMAALAAAGGEPGPMQDAKPLPSVEIPRAGNYASPFAPCTADTVAALTDAQVPKERPSTAHALVPEEWPSTAVQLTPQEWPSTAVQLTPQERPSTAVQLTPQERPSTAGGSFAMAPAPPVSPFLAASQVLPTPGIDVPMSPGRWLGTAQGGHDALKAVRVSAPASILGTSPRVQSGTTSPLALRPSVPISIRHPQHSPTGNGGWRGHGLGGTPRGNAAAAPGSFTTSSVLSLASCGGVGPLSRGVSGQPLGLFRRVQAPQGQAGTSGLAARDDDVQARRRSDPNMLHPSPFDSAADAASPENEQGAGRDVSLLPPHPTAGRFTPRSSSEPALQSPLRGSANRPLSQRGSRSGDSGCETGPARSGTESLAGQAYGDSIQMSGLESGLGLGVVSSPSLSKPSTPHLPSPPSTGGGRGVAPAPVCPAGGHPSLLRAEEAVGHDHTAAADDNAAAVTHVASLRAMEQRSSNPSRILGRLSAGLGIGGNGGGRASRGSSVTVSRPPSRADSLDARLSGLAPEGGDQAAAVEIRFIELAPGETYSSPSDGITRHAWYVQEGELALCWEARLPISLSAVLATALRDNVSLPLDSGLSGPMDSAAFDLDSEQLAVDARSATLAGTVREAAARAANLLRSAAAGDGGRGGTDDLLRVRRGPGQFVGALGMLDPAFFRDRWKARLVALTRVTIIQFTPWGLEALLEQNPLLQVHLRASLSLTRAEIVKLEVLEKLAECAHTSYLRKRSNMARRTSAGGDDATQTASAPVSLGPVSPVADPVADAVADAVAERAASTQAAADGSISRQSTRKSMLQGPSPLGHDDVMDRFAFVSWIRDVGTELVDAVSSIANIPEWPSMLGPTPEHADGENAKAAPPSSSKTGPTSL